jgi:hypothetical protein
MKKYRHRTQRSANKPFDAGGFELPPDISVRRQELSYGWAFVFRHRVLGELGRIVLRDTTDGRTHLSYEVVGYPRPGFG